VQDDGEFALNFPTGIVMLLLTLATSLNFSKSSPKKYRGFVPMTRSRAITARFADARKQSTRR
jgi:hypothetical protein